MTKMKRKHMQSKYNVLRYIRSMYKSPWEHEDRHASAGASGYYFKLGMT